MHDVVFHVRRLSARRLGIECENPIDPRVRHRADGLGALTDLLETEPDLEAGEVRATLEQHAAVLATVGTDHRDAFVGVTGLHRWEVEAAGIDPGKGYFARLAFLDEAGRRAMLERCRHRADRDGTP